MVLAAAAKGASIAPNVIIVIGTLGGAVVGAGVGLLGQHLNHRHDDRRRWHTERLAAYTTFIAATDAAVRSGREGDAMEEVYQAGDLVSFVATAPVGDRCQLLIEAYRTFLEDPREVVFLTRMADLRTEFIMAVRAELGVDA